MELSKAIELSPEIEDSLRKHKFIDYADTVKLGREALKRLQEFRLRLYPDTIQLLPGETPEINTKRSLHHIKETLESPIGEK